MLISSILKRNSHSKSEIKKKYFLRSEISHQGVIFLTFHILQTGQHVSILANFSVTVKCNLKPNF